MVKNAQELLNKAEELGYTFVQNLYENKISECYKKNLNSYMKILTKKQKQLREFRVKRNIALVNQMKIVGDA